MGRSDLDLQRRTFFKGSALALAAAATGQVSGIALGAGTARAATSQLADGTRIEAEERWVKKGDVKLFLYRKRQIADGPTGPKPVLFLVHGSSFSATGGYDLQVPGHANYSFMDQMASYGFDVWTMDHENYGRSDRTSGFSDIRSGVEDLKVALPVVEQVTGQRAVKFYGQSSGALRLGVFAIEHPDRVDRILLEAFTHTGEGAPEIMRRRRDVEDYKKVSHRKTNRETFYNIFRRDDPSTFEMPMADALADYELKLGSQNPNGTYIDMAINLPLVDPTKLTCPVCIVRPEHDGNATDEELLAFFSKLPNRDRQFVMVKGVAHVAVLGINRHRIWHVAREFFSYPDLRSA